MQSATQLHPIWRDYPALPTGAATSDAADDGEHQYSRCRHQ
ncbi:hypothetical protein LAP9571_01946 [Lactiplantibacillus plantarum]|nr:hypothetical protein LAP9571_01946 [Lactiplantibacillus plantarum]VFI60273.1 hypothetical protein LAP9492_01946 [Lactiplantibacillus plantarum]